VTHDEVHSAAQKGFTNEAATYARGRPDYPAELQGWLRETLKLGPDARVADVGAGTGKFCRLLLATGADVTAVEPLAPMREQAARIAGLRVLDGTAQQIPLPGASLDAVVCAQAFHWFSSRESLDEFARVLAPGGKLGLVWNVRDESVDWVHRITGIITPHEGDAPRYYKGEWRDAFPHPGFGPLELSVFGYEHTGPPQQVILDRIMSVSFIASLAPGPREHVRTQLQELVDTHPALRGRDVVTLPYRTEAFVAIRAH
jgi:SAM-dependent methyltransferase